MAHTTWIDSCSNTAVNECEVVIYVLEQHSTRSLSLTCWQYKFQGVESKDSREYNCLVGAAEIVTNRLTKPIK